MDIAVELRICLGISCMIFFLVFIVVDNVVSGLLLLQQLQLFIWIHVEIVRLALEKEI